MKYYSEITKQFYDSASECNSKEAEYKQKQREKELAEQKKASERKLDAEKVELTRKALLKARDDYNEALSDFCKKHGSYHCSYHSDDINDLFKLMFGKYW